MVDQKWLELLMFLIGEHAGKLADQVGLELG